MRRSISRRIRGSSGRGLKVGSRFLLAGETVEEFAGWGEFVEELFFGTELRGMRDQAAAGAACRMLDVKHFVVEDVFDDELRDLRAAHAAIQENLIGAGIVAAELTAPATGTPTDVGTFE